MVSRDEKRWRFFAHVVLIILSFMAVMPFILLVIASFTDEAVALADGYSYFPEKFSLAAYQYIANEAVTIFRAYGVTIIVTVVGTCVSLIITAMLVVICFPVKAFRDGKY